MRCYALTKNTNEKNEIEILSSEKVCEQSFGTSPRFSIYIPMRGIILYIPNGMIPIFNADCDPALTSCPNIGRVLSIYGDRRESWNIYANPEIPTAENTNGYQTTVSWMFLLMPQRFEKVLQKNSIGLKSEQPIYIDLVCNHDTFIRKRGSRFFDYAYGVLVFEFAT